VSASSSRRATAADSSSRARKRPFSTGIFGYPQREAADTAIATIAAELERHALPERVILCTYDLLATTIVTEAFAAA
jgi:O-acetyl-ADP-ribose deacetylase (regulator of RNase III)